MRSNIMNDDNFWGWMAVIILVLAGHLGFAILLAIF